MFHPWNGSSLIYITESEAIKKEEPFFLKCLIAQCPPSQKAIASTQETLSASNILVTQLMLWAWVLILSFF